MNEEILQKKINKIRDAEENGSITNTQVAEILTALNEDKLEKDLSNIPEEQKALLRGEKGDAFRFEDFTEEQLERLKGGQGLRGEKGEDAVLPDNLAKIDKEGEEGNVHTKEQIEELLENRGKNIGNSNMKVPEGTERTLDLTRARFRTSGLEDKANDLSFSKILVMNERGVWGTVPYIKHQYNSSNITINSVVPQNLAPRPTFTEDVERILKDYKTYQFEDIDLSTFSQEGNMMISPFSLDSDSDFVVEFQGVKGNTTGEEIGIGRYFSTEFAAITKITGGFWWYLKGSQATYSNALDTNTLTNLIIIKTGGVITIGRLVLNRIDYTSFNANAELGDYKIIHSPSLSISKIKLKRL